MYSTIKTLDEIVKETQQELRRIRIDEISKEIIILLVKTSFQIGRMEGMTEMFETMRHAIANGPEPKPEEPQPEPEPAAPEPQGEYRL